MKGETKEERFKRVVQKRVQNVLDSLRRLSQCSNKRMYAWNDDQLKTIWVAIDKEKLVRRALTMQSLKNSSYSL